MSCTRALYSASTSKLRSEGAAAAMVQRAATSERRGRECLVLCWGPGSRLGIAGDPPRRVEAAGLHLQASRADTGIARDAGAVLGGVQLLLRHGRQLSIRLAHAWGCCTVWLSDDGNTGTSPATFRHSGGFVISECVQSSLLARRAALNYCTSWHLTS